MLWPDDVGWTRPVQLVRQAIESHLHRVPRFRQILYVPRRGLGWPLWVDAPAFDISDHVKVRPLPIPGTEDHLLRTVEKLRRSPLDRAKPLWQHPASVLEFVAVAEGAPGRGVRTVAR